ncbi:MAG: DUF72 domain-containing protein, partial [Acidobacteria bacterium]
HEFRTVELNNPFYRLPERETFARWQERTPDDFLFAVKASRFITHIKRLRDCSDPLRFFLEHAWGLGKKLGPILFQLPPQMHADLERLGSFLGILPRSETFALEFRHESWLAVPVFELLRRHRVALCIPVKGAVEPDSPAVTGRVGYLRMHSGAGPDGEFTLGQLRGWAGLIRKWLGDGMDVYVYFNNDWQGFAVRNALQLRRLLKIRR